MELKARRKYVSTLNTVSECSSSLESIRHAYIKLKTVYDSVNDAIFIHELDGRIIDVNKRMLEMYGVNREEALKLSILLDYSSKENPLEELEGIWNEVVKGEKAVFEWIAKRPKEGTTFYAEVFLRKLDFGGRPAILATVRDITKQKNLEEKLRQLSALDGLTELANRRFFDEFLEREWQRAKRSKMPISLLMADIDFFKAYNDTYGHLAGDDCLKRVALVIKNRLKRPGDLAARYGGEEFAGILTETDAVGALRVAEDIRRGIEDLQINHSASPISNNITISIGVATVSATANNSPTFLIDSSDKALYMAKQKGRNRVEQEIVEG